MHCEPTYACKNWKGLKLEQEQRCAQGGNRVSLKMILLNAFILKYCNHIKMLVPQTPRFWFSDVE